jgi:hypothetical protein
MRLMSTAVVLAWIAIALLALGMAGIMRQVRLLSSGSPRERFVFGPRAGSPGPQLPSLEAIDGTALLLFLDKDCSTCRRVAPVFSEIASEHAGTSFVVMFRGEQDGLVGDSVLAFENQGVAFAEFHVPATPFVVAVDENGIVTGSSLIGSVHSLRGTIHSVLERSNA